MATKCIVLGEKIVKKPTNKIVLDMFLTTIQPKFIRSQSKADEYDYIELISLMYCDGKDLMYAYYDPKERSNGILYLGHWNDGIV